MSLIPFLLDDFSHRPSRIFSQIFGLGLDTEDLLKPTTFFPSNNMGIMRIPFSYLRPWRSRAAEKDVGSTVKCDKEKFQVDLDVQHFKPDEITVKLIGENTITVEGKHEEKEDEHGFVYRHFIRKYTLPKGHDIHKLESKLSSVGVLTIIAPKVNQDAIEGHKTIPIQQTGLPTKAISNNKKENVES